MKSGRYYHHIDHAGIIFLCCSICPDTGAVSCKDQWGRVVIDPPEYWTEV